MGCTNAISGKSRIYEQVEATPPWNSTASPVEAAPDTRPDARAFRDHRILSDSTSFERVVGEPRQGAVVGGHAFDQVQPAVAVLELEELVIATVTSAV
jgi:hypothetical protein